MVSVPLPSLKISSQQLKTGLYPFLLCAAKEVTLALLITSQGPVLGCLSCGCEKTHLHPEKDAFCVLVWPAENLGPPEDFAVARNESGTSFVSAQLLAATQACATLEVQQLAAGGVQVRALNKSGEAVGPDLNCASTPSLFRWRGRSSASRVARMVAFDFNTMITNMCIGDGVVDLVLEPGGKVVMKTAFETGFVETQVTTNVDPPPHSGSEGALLDVPHPRGAFLAKQVKVLANLVIKNSLLHLRVENGHRLCISSSVPGLRFSWWFPLAT